MKQSTGYIIYDGISLFICPSMALCYTSFICIYCYLSQSFYSCIRTVYNSATDFFTIVYLCNKLNIILFEYFLFLIRVCTGHAGGGCISFTSVQPQLSLILQYCWCSLLVC